MSTEKLEKLIDMEDVDLRRLQKVVEAYIGNVRNLSDFYLYSTPNVTRAELLRMQELASEEELLEFAHKHGIEAYHPNTFFKKVSVIKHKDELREINGGFAWVVYVLLHPMYYSMPKHKYAWTSSGCNAIEEYDRWHNGVSVYPSVVSPRLRIKKRSRKKEGRQYGRLVKHYGISRRKFNPETGEIKHGIIRNPSGNVDRIFALIPYNALTSAILKELRYRINWGKDWQALRMLNSIATQQVYGE